MDPTNPLYGSNRYLQAGKEGQFLLRQLVNYSGEDKVHLLVGSRRGGKRGSTLASLASQVYNYGPFGATSVLIVVPFFWYHTQTPVPSHPQARLLYLSCF